VLQVLSEMYVVSLKLRSHEPRVMITRAIPKSTSDWLVKKNKIENKTLLYGTVTYITALILHIVTIHI
jgi:hypothetical protein